MAVSLLPSRIHWLAKQNTVVIVKVISWGLRHCFSATDLSVSDFQTHFYWDCSCFPPINFGFRNESFACWSIHCCVIWSVSCAHCKAVELRVCSASEPIALHCVWSCIRQYRYVYINALPIIKKCFVPIPAAFETHQPIFLTAFTAVWTFCSL